jgi:hypothetical protein
MTENQQNTIDTFNEREAEYDLAIEATADLLDKEDLNKITREQVRILRGIVDTQQRTMDAMNIRLNRAFKTIGLLANPLLNGE